MPFQEKPKIQAEDVPRYEPLPRDELEDIYFEDFVEIPLERPIPVMSQDDIPELIEKLKNKPELENIVKLQMIETYREALSGGQITTIRQIMEGKAELDIDGKEENEQTMDDEILPENLPEIQKYIEHIDIVDLLTVMSIDGYHGSKNYLTELTLKMKEQEEDSEVI